MDRDRTRRRAADTKPEGPPAVNPDDAIVDSSGDLAVYS